MDKAQKNKTKTIIRRANILESLKDLGSDTGNSIKKDLLEGASKSMLDQLFGRNTVSEKHSGEIFPGESLEFNDLISGKYEENLKLKKQLFLERKLIEEERELSEKSTNQLRVQLQALTQEVLSLAKSTKNLEESVEIAAMQAPSQPGIYHLIYFEKLLDFIRSFRKKIDEASVWLQSSNKRAEKKNYWTMYKKKGSSFLLSPDHYLSRAAG